AFPNQRAPNFWIGHPVRSRDARRIDSAVDHRRTVAAGYVPLHFHIDRRKAPVESNRKLAITVFRLRPQEPALLFGDRHGLFYKYMLAGAQRGRGLCAM